MKIYLILILFLFGCTFPQPSVVRDPTPFFSDSALVETPLLPDQPSSSIITITESPVPGFRRTSPVFTPYSLTVRQGSTLTFVNQGSEPHSITLKLKKNDGSITRYTPCHIDSKDYCTYTLHERGILKIDDLYSPTLEMNIPVI